MRNLAIALMVVFSGFFSADAQQPAIGPGVPIELAKWRAANYSNIRYRLDIALEKGAPLMKGTVTVSVDLTEEGAKYPLVLDWRTTQFAADKDRPFANVVDVNDIKASIGARTEQEHIIIPDGHLKTGTNTVTIEFASPVKTSGAAVTRYVDKQDGGEYLYSLFVPSDASTAIPVFDQPDLKARFTLTVTAPNGWEVVSNSVYEPLSPEADPTKVLTSQPSKIHRFSETAPISTYVFAFAAGDFVRLSDPANPKSAIRNPQSSDVYVRRSQVEKFNAHAAEFFRLNRESVRYFEEYFDYRFPFPKYDLILIPEFPFGGMEHAGATFLREAAIIFPSEPTKNDFVARANLIFHEAAHQWFGDLVTMRWFDDLWLKEGFATFIGYKALEKLMPEYNAWKVFYERQKQSAYLTDSTQGTTPIYQEIPNLSAAKSAYGAIVYSKAPSFLKQAEFFLSEDNFRTAVRSFLKKHEFGNATWTDLVREFEIASRQNLAEWAPTWVTRRGLPIMRMEIKNEWSSVTGGPPTETKLVLSQKDALGTGTLWAQRLRFLYVYEDGTRKTEDVLIGQRDAAIEQTWGISLDSRASAAARRGLRAPKFVFANHQDFGYGIFLVDAKSRDYIIRSVGAEKDDFVRSMMWGALWDSVRAAELDPRVFVDLVVRNLRTETDESTIQTLLGRVGTAMNYYIDEGSAANALRTRIENAVIERLGNAATMGQRITFYRALLNLGASPNAKLILREILAGKSRIARFELRTKDKFDIVTRLIVLGDTGALTLLSELEAKETSDDARRYAYAARAGVSSTENKARYWSDFVANKEISESWIEAAFVVFNSPRHSALTAPYLERALAELPNLKRNRKIFFVNGWLGAFIGGQRDAASMAVVKKFLDSNPNLDRDLRLKILENADGLERAIRIRSRE